MILKEKIKQKKATVAIVGLGYVGLPLALTIVDAGFTVLGIDTDKRKITALKHKRSYIDDISNANIKLAFLTKRFTPTTSFAAAARADVIIIAVPTPLKKDKTPDLGFLHSAGKSVGAYVHDDQLIILESTTYPGTTREELLPLLMGKKATRNFYLAFSPERVDPGNKQFIIKNTPKVVGGIDKTSTALATLFYKQCIDTVVPVSSAEAAEMTKILENTYRAVNISLVNELTLLSDKLNINFWEVIDAAATKPYGFMPFYPGPGIGGHCIAIDPFYLSYKARQHGFFTRFIDLAGEINALMPHAVVTKVIAALNYTSARAVNTSKILLMGVAYKKNIKDIRESAAIEIAEMLHKKGARLSYYDPYVSSFSFDSFSVPRITTFTQAMIRSFDLVLILTDHSGVDYTMIAQQATAVVDTRGILKHVRKKNVYIL